MAITPTPAASLAETVKEETKSPRTTTALTLKLLCALLGSAEPIDQTPSSASTTERDTVASAKAAGTVSAKVPAKSARPVKSRVAAKVTIYTAPETCSPLSTNSQKVALATETFNTTLKSLSNAARSRNATRAPPNSTPSRISSPPRLSRPENHRPLQQTSPNRQPNPSSSQKLKQKLPVENGPPDPGHVTTAQCARTALDCLRRLEKTDTKARDLQLDRGSLILLENLNNLTLPNLAIQEVCVLKERLDQRIRVGNGNSTSAQGIGSRPPSCPSDSVVRALLFDALPNYADLCNLVISFQRQVLKTVAFRDVNGVCQSLVDSLQINIKYGPYGMIIQGHKSNLLSAEKTSLHLQALAHAVSSLGSSALSSEIIFQLQLAALEIHCSSWTLTKAQPDLGRGVWAPFTRIVAKFCQTSRVTKAEQYGRARDGLQRVKSALRTSSTDVVFRDELEIPTCVSECLAKLAQGCGCHADSIDLLQQSLQASNDPQSLSTTICRCKIATLRLQAFSDDPTAALSAAEEALSSLRGSIKGSARELEDLLLHGVRLRKIALDILRKFDKSIEFAPLVDVQVKLRSCATRIIYAFLNFVSRYIGGSPLAREASPAQMKHFHHKVHLARSVAEITISNALSAARSSIDDSASMWVEVDSALYDCHALAQTLDLAKEPSGVPEESPPTISTFLKISSMYWSRFLRHKEVMSEPAELLILLKNSTRVLEDRPEPERAVGFLAVKYEKMASIYQDLKRYDKASEALQRAILNHVSSSGFQEVIRTGSSQSMRFSWDSNASPIFALGKTLAAYVKLGVLSHQSKQDGQEFCDDEALPTEERVALLERQFVVCMSVEPVASKLASIADLARLILSLYNPTHTLRRIQFLLGVLKYSSRCHNDPVEDILAGQLTEDKLSKLDHDLHTNASLSPCGVPLFASMRLQWAFKKSRPSTQLLREMVNSWLPLISDYDGWQTIENYLDDPSLLSSQLQAIIDFTDMQGLVKVRLSALHLQQKILESQKRIDHVALARSLIQKGLQCSRLGFSIDAGRALASARKCIESSNSQPAVSLQYHLAHAEYLLNISSLEGYAQALDAARTLYAAAFTPGHDDGKQHLSLSQTRILYQSASLISRREFERGNLSNAVFLAKQCFKLSSQIWAGVQRIQGCDRLRKTQEGNDSTLDGLVEDLSNMNVSNKSATELPAIRGAAFWPYVSVHCEALMHLSYLLANCGLYQDAIYYADQAQRVALAVDSPAYVFKTSTLLLAHQRKGNDLNAGLERSSTRRPPLEEEYASISIVSSSVYLAEASISAGQFSAAFEAIEDATQCLSVIHSRDLIVPTAIETEESPSTMGAPILTGSKSKTRTKFADKNSRKRAQAKSAPPPEKGRPAPAVEIIAKGESMLSVTSARFEITINVLKAHLMLSSGQCQDAAPLLAMSTEISLPGPDLIRRRLVEARTILDEILKSLSADAVHCVLAETTIAFPSLHRKEQAPGKKAILHSPAATKTPSRAGKAGAPNRRKIVHHDTDSDQPPHLVMRATGLLMEAIKSTASRCPTNMLREVSTMLNQCFMLSSILLRQRNYNPVQIALQAAAPNCSAMARESSVIMTDVALTNKSYISSWPGPAPGDKGRDQLTLADTTSIAPGFLDKLPEEWNVVSMELSRTRDELSITKLHVGQPPFSLRIPLRRSGSDELNDEDFGFASAKVELLDIIKTANMTAHDSRGQSDKQAKKSWWAGREALDDRLKILLENIENVWLGGFRGILAHQHRHQDLLSRFSGSLLRSLDQYLPSRQKSRRPIGAEFHLHAHVLDLFVALGDPDEHDLDDSIADLLYFVVDILQFEGEHNAYDEIDFDMITMEVLDALRCYHEALKVLDAKSTQHTILILDKELLAFPWESLPCLDGRPVSRMPSLSCVQARLDQIRLQDADAPALSIFASNGAYILNPSSDLTSTQVTFEGAFSSAFPSFMSIVNRAPTEAEFESYLHEKDLFLYFGHGSGAQYIRGRTIKRLNRCAVTFLMGCSSGKMIECGEFEPYGVPWNYMHASSPAVVGTLWDVTDKDIDRFAMTTFIEWGLLGEEALTKDTAEAKRKGKNMKSKGKGRKQPSQNAAEGASSEQKVALDEAVARARSSCVLKYLNGAAPVIYGIPVVLR